MSEVLFNSLKFEYQSPINVNVIEFDDITMKTKFVVGDGSRAIRFDEKSFFVLSLVLLQFGIMKTIMNTLAKKL